MDKFKQYGIGIAFIACAIAAGIARHFFPTVVREEYVAALSTLAALGLWLIRSPLPAEAAPETQKSADPKRSVPPLPILLMIVLAALTITACPPSATPAAAGAAYQAELLACVEKSPTREASDACRAEVNDRWGRAADGGPLPDGGAQ
jgi:hypothetical protein